MRACACFCELAVSSAIPHFLPTYKFFCPERSLNKIKQSPCSSHVLCMCHISMSSRRLWCWTEIQAQGDVPDISSGEAVVLIVFSSCCLLFRMYGKTWGSTSSELASKALSQVGLGHLDGRFLHGESLSKSVDAEPVGHCRKERLALEVLRKRHWLRDLTSGV